MKVLVLGANGMLGNEIFQAISKSNNIDSYGTLRHSNLLNQFAPELSAKLIDGVEASNLEGVRKILRSLLPEKVINCIAINHFDRTRDQIDAAYKINVLLPHFLAKECRKIGSRLIHISTDGVFSGIKGGYSEFDIPDPIDEYGLQKLQGEVYYENCITLRTSMIGHSLNGQSGLLDWFLGQQDFCKGYINAMFSGLPTIEIANIIKDIIIPDASLTGLYHLSADPISKYEVLELIASEYEKKIELIADNSFTINRTLDSSKFKLHTGYTAPSWEKLISHMKNAHQKFK
ncbi:SDR family oxidoreductase [Polynucleobacter sp. AP-Sanab-80-C2]|uniref:dTDP-4-dehydrorhamnose reductase family protein n=1 Tax=Polynucleobacter sp. AP-Sanab-80-C2 TaxID=3108274 RepID=UPI002B22614B|nr:SDR family oxidoreductase [Polynucleobacter sp. AP-Sanab-80-C2]MEA9598545.1 SDR family oxidoreductase [Polynucleobacter sp. AP-Sanab-80-C2]